MVKRIGVLTSLIVLSSTLIACGSDHGIDPGWENDVGADVARDSGRDSGRDSRMTSVDSGPACIQNDDKWQQSAGCGEIAAPILYHSGEVMKNGANVYFVWYGDWKDSSIPTILEDLAKNIGNTPYYNINKGYFENSSIEVTGNAGGFPVYVSGRVTLIRSITVGYTHGKNLSDEDVKAIVDDSINSGELPFDWDGTYFVMGSKKVQQHSGGYTFCGSYCGWHDHGKLMYRGDPERVIDLKYSFVGNPDQCLRDCTIYSNERAHGIEVSPNGDWAADSMASVWAHELSEMVTDPYLTAWWDSYGWQNADKCAWTFGQTYCAANGAMANVKIGDRDYLLQRNWVNDPVCGRCDMKP